MSIPKTDELGKIKRTTKKRTNIFPDPDRVFLPAWIYNKSSCRKSPINLFITIIPCLRFKHIQGKKKEAFFGFAKNITI